VLPLRSFTDGPLLPLLSYVASCVGVFLGLRCATRARACQGSSRGRWLLLAAVAIGTAGTWGMDFIALLGFGVAGQTTRYNVLIVIVSLLVAMVAAAAGLLIIGADRDESRALPGSSLIVSGVVLGTGVTIAHYLAMAALRVSGRLSYNPLLVVFSLVLAILAATVLLRSAVRLRSTGATVGASLIVGVLFTATHYTAMAAVHVSPASGPAGLTVGGPGGATASSFLLPVILSLSVMAFLVCAAIALSPTEDAMRYDAALLDRIRARSATPLDTRAAVLRPSRNADGVPLRNGTPVWNGTAPDPFPGPGAAGHGRAGRHSGAAGDGSAAGNGFAPDDGPARQVPPWALGEFPERTDPS
jgi:NO-binding membrane sensor protein with MHYT domain